MNVFLAWVVGTVMFLVEMVFFYFKFWWLKAEYAMINDPGFFEKTSNNYSVNFCERFIQPKQRGLGV